MPKDRVLDVHPLTSSPKPVRAGKSRTRREQRWFLSFAFAPFFAIGAVAGAQLPLAPALPAPDARYKADILVFVPHPDDTTLIDGYLARASLDEHRRVAVIFATTGESGSNAAGPESGVAMGQEMILESRRGLERIGITNIWSVDGRDTPGQNVLWSLGNWNHGRVLGEVVRLVRLTRPEVIIAMIPDYVAGENHSDHQATGVIATEAFDLAGDPTSFPEQVTPPRDPHGMENRTDGLRPWQPQKLYYYTDAFENYSQYWNDKADASPFRKSFMEGTGPHYSNLDISPSRHVPYGELGALEESAYETQASIGDIAIEAIKIDDFKKFREPARLIFAKSVVKCNPTDDVFAGVVDGPVPFVKVRGYESELSSALTFEFGDPWSYYAKFWRAHEVDCLAALMPTPEVALDGGETLRVPMALYNGTTHAGEVSVSVAAPDGWTEKAGSARYPLPSGGSYPFQAILVAPSGRKPQWQEITWTAKTGDKQIGKLTFRVLLGKSGGLPQ